MNSFTIKDLENLSGIKAHTIRIWEQRYSFLKPSRTPTRIRNYKSEEVKKLLNVSLLNKFGFKISHIDRMSDYEMNENILSLTEPLALQENIVNQLISNMADLDMETFERILGDYIMSKGIERTIIRIIFPFLDRIGILWQTGNINPSQEHLVSNIIRQKLIAGIESVKVPAHSNSTILLFLPEGEHHELGLLFMNFILKSKGIRVIYLGANIPLNDVEYIVNIKKPDYLYIHLTTAGANFKFEKFIAALSEYFGKLPVVISGKLTTSYEKKVKPPVVFKRSLAEAMDFASGLT